MTEAAQACAWGMTHESVIANGTIRFVENPEEKKRALDLLMARYAGSERTFSFPKMMLKRLVVLQMDIQSITGKRSS